MLDFKDRIGGGNKIKRTKATTRVVAVGLYKRDGEKNGTMSFGF